MASQDSEFFRVCAREINSICRGFIHPLDPHRNCYLCRGDCGANHSCGECRNWNDQQRDAYEIFLEIIPKLLDVPVRSDSVPIENGTLSLAVEGPAPGVEVADSHPSVSIQQDSSSFLPLGSDAVDQVVLTVSSNEPCETTTSQTLESSLEPHTGSSANVDSFSATSLQFFRAGEVLNDYRGPHNRTTRVLATSEAAQEPIPLESPSHGPHPSHATKVSSTMNLEGYPYHHPSPCTKVFGSEASSQPSMRVQVGSPKPRGTPKQEGVGRSTHPRPGVGNAASAGDLPGFPRVTPISRPRAPKTLQHQDMLRNFPSSAPLNPRGSTSDPKKSSHHPGTKEDMQRFAMTNTLFNRTMNSFLEGIRTEPHPSSGRWEKKDTTSVKKGAALPRSQSLLSSSASEESSSSSFSSSGTPSPDWQSGVGPASSTIPSFSRGPRLDGFPPHQPVRGGGVGAVPSTSGREVPGHPNGPRPGGNPAAFRGNIGRPRNPLIALIPLARNTRAPTRSPWRRVLWRDHESPGRIAMWRDHVSPWRKVMWRDQANRSLWIFEWIFDRLWNLSAGFTALRPLNLLPLEEILLSWKQELTKLLLECLLLTLFQCRPQPSASLNSLMRMQRRFLPLAPKPSLSYSLGQPVNKNFMTMLTSG